MSELPVSKRVKSNAEEVLAKGVQLVDNFVNKNYLIDIDKSTPIPLEESEKTYYPMSLYQIEKIVYDPNENINDKLVSVYSALSNFGSTAILIISSDKTGVGFYLGTRDKNRPDVAREILKKSLKGNFPGITLHEKKADQIQQFLETKIPTEYSNMAVTSVSIVPGMRDEEDKYRFVQGIEKFIDSMAGESYTAIFVSSPLSKQELENKKRGYEILYSCLSQFSQVAVTYSENESESVAEGISKSMAQSTNAGISDVLGTSSGQNSNRGRTSSFGTNWGVVVLGFNKGSGSNISEGVYQGSTSSHTDSRSNTSTNSETRSNTKTNLTGSSANLQLTQHNKSVEELLEKIDEQLVRIRNCESYGLWNSACYFISDSEEVAVVAANTYKALVAGEKTSVENSFINIWDSEYEHHEKSLAIMEYLRYGLHPKFEYDPDFDGPDYDRQEVTVASLVSGLELPLLMGLPHKSVTGITSIKSAEFGRNVFRKNGEEPQKKVNIGSIYHMGELFCNNQVELDLETLASHCFITGSTGSGKSNTTFHILDEVTKPGNDIRFMVIEPAKGEYKQHFGKMENVNIYTTNPRFYSMLCINPFEFNDEIHVLEHLDRLIEIFSACWPLYAAMPAVLKSSFEQAYIKHGWDLNHSTYQDMGNGKFPDFKDVVEVLPIILNESDFSAETKGNYVGSLVTRVESLTNGIIGRVLNGVAVPDKTLFDENTIVDLSRVGSTETKALIMGVLVLKLSEYRQSTSVGTNLPLKHITIMEEAHNLLKRTSSEQSQESANVQGKSVEMISNSIAEMRTYGEGFIIVDQSPTAVDISAIKNTNTKIVMRLPELLDCELIGHSIGLNDEQVVELSKLDKGVAAVFQNDWLETVLVGIEKSSDEYLDEIPIENDSDAEKEMIYLLIEELINESRSRAFDQEKLLNTIKSNSNKLDKMTRKRTEELVIAFYDEWKKGSNRNILAELIFTLLDCSNLLRMYEPMLPQGIRKKSMLDDNIRLQAYKWAKCVYEGLDRYVLFHDPSVKDAVFKNVILHEIAVNKRSDQYKVALYCIREGKLNKT